jgi:hypothetical protein
MQEAKTEILILRYNVHGRQISQGGQPIMDKHKTHIDTPIVRPRRTGPLLSIETRQLSERSAAVLEDYKRQIELYECLRPTQSDPSFVKPRKVAAMKLQGVSIVYEDELPQVEQKASETAHSAFSTEQQVSPAPESVYNTPVAGQVPAQGFNLPEILLSFTPPQMTRQITDGTLPDGTEPPDELVEEVNKPMRKLDFSKYKG